MPHWNLVEAINSALRISLNRDNRIIILGEDIAKIGGVFRATKGLLEEFGEARVMDTPLSEGGIVGIAIGMAAYGLRPVVEIQFADFIYPAFDQIVSELAKLRYRSGGQYSAPMVIRAPYGGGVKGGLYHSQSPETHFIHTPGLKVVVPSHPYQAKGLLTAAIQDEEPVIFLEPKRVYRAHREEVPEDYYTLPLGKARVSCIGENVTVVAWGAMHHEATTAIEQANERNISCELIDLQTLHPMDIQTVITSVRKTGRLVVVHEAPRTGGFAGEIISQVTESCFYHLECPPLRITGADTPFPYTGEMDYLPLAPRILAGIEAIARPS
ncbi:MAG: alpha-ketoacid dehydrogenase subunit beta [Myxococcales bacterium]|nr:alpha-ketoacid dehydrogenase subunit beta [Myxococcales bacterium]